MKLFDKLSIIDMTKFDEDILSPEEYLKLTKDQKKDIAKTTPIVKTLGQTSIHNVNFVSLHVKWKTPKYKVSL